MSLLDEVLEEEEAQAPRRSLVDDVLEEEVRAAASPPSRAARLSEALSAHREESASPQSFARRTLGAPFPLNLPGLVVTGAEELGALAGSEALYNLGSGQEMLTPEQIAALPPDKRRDAERRQMPGLRAAFEEVRDLAAATKRAPDIGVRDGQLVNRQTGRKVSAGDFALDAGTAMLEGAIKTDARGGPRREAPIASGGDMLTVGGVGSALARAKQVAGAPARAGARKLSESTGISAEKLRADDLAQASTQARRAADNARIQARTTPEIVRYQERALEVQAARDAYEAALKQRLRTTPEIRELEQAAHYFRTTLDDPAAFELARQAKRDAWAARFSSPDTKTVATARAEMKRLEDTLPGLRHEANRAGLLRLRKDAQRTTREADVARRESNLAKTNAEKAAERGGLAQSGVDWLFEKTPRALRPRTETMDRATEWLRRQGLEPTPQNIEVAMLVLGLEAQAGTSLPAPQRGRLGVDPG